MSEGIQKKFCVELILDSTLFARIVEAGLALDEDPISFFYQRGIKFEVRPLPFSDAMLVASFPGEAEKFILQDFLLRVPVQGRPTSEICTWIDSQLSLCTSMGRGVVHIVFEGDFCVNRSRKEQQDLFRYIRLIRRREEIEDGYTVWHSKSLKQTFSLYELSIRDEEDVCEMMWYVGVLRQRTNIKFSDWNQRMQKFNTILSAERSFASKLWSLPSITPEVHQDIIGLGYGSPKSLGAAYDGLKTEKEKESFLYVCCRTIRRECSKDVYVLWKHTASQHYLQE